MSYLFNPLSTKPAKWHSVANFFFNVFPTLAQASLVKLLGSVTPAVLVPELMWTINKALSHSTGCIVLVWFLATRIGCLFLGFDAFLYKFQILAEQYGNLKNPEGVDTTDLLVNTVLFVNQMLGVVQLGTFTKKRLFVFIFAGEDGAMSEKEDAVRRTWEAFFCYKVFEEHGPIKSILIYLSFSDTDFQKMVLDTEGEGQKEKDFSDNTGMCARLCGICGLG